VDKQPWPDTLRELADHIELDHEKELTPGTMMLRTVHRDLHALHDHWNHSH
jgi:hypothetical protein